MTDHMTVLARRYPDSFAGAWVRRRDDAARVRLAREHPDGDPDSLLEQDEFVNSIEAVRATLAKDRDVPLDRVSYGEAMTLAAETYPEAFERYERAIGKGA